MALFVQYLQYVSVVFYRPEFLVQGMTSLERLIRRMSHVTKIRISCDCEPDKVDHARYLERMGGLLAALAGKACDVLSVSGWQKRPTKKWSTWMKLTFTSQPRDIPPLTTLTGLEIRRSDLSAPILRTWFINSANSSPITRLALDNATFYNGRSTMSEILRLLELPNLSYFDISSKELIFGDIVEFLCRHPHIISLSLATDNSITSNSTFPVDALPVLSSLRAPPHYVRHIFASRNALPSLTSLVIDPDFRPMIYLQQPDINRRFDGIEECFSHVASRKSITTLTLIMPPESWAEQWLRQGSPLELEHGERRDIERSLVNIATLNVNVSGCITISPSMKPLFVGWLALFPALRSVHFDSYTFGGMSSEEQSAFADSIGHACSNMEIVEFSYTRYAITH
jgi:hypothetical protein